MAIERTAGGSVIFTGPDVNRLRLVVIKSALSLEAQGLRASRGRSALAAAKEVSGLKARTAAEMLPKYCAWVEAQLGTAAEGEK